MKFPFFNISLERRLSLGRRLDVLELSFDGMIDEVQALAVTLGEASRKAEATRQKVYRDDKESDVKAQAGQTDLAARLESLNPGDPPPLGFNE